MGSQRAATRLCHPFLSQALALPILLLPQPHWTLQHREVMAASRRAKLQPFVRPITAAHCTSSAEVETPNPPPRLIFCGVQMGYEDAKPISRCLQSLQTPLTWELWASSCLKSAQHSNALLETEPRAAQSADVSGVTRGYGRITRHTDMASSRSAEESQAQKS